MRYSVMGGDPGFVPWCMDVLDPSCDIKVTLNGIEVHEVFTVDDELGEIVKVARDEYGDIIIDGDQVALETVRGVVRIELNRRDPPGCRTSRDSRTDTGLQPDAGPGSREAGA